MTGGIPRGAPWNEAAAGPRRPSRKNRAPVYALLTANAISLVGSMVTTVALPWFVLQTTGSAAKTGLVGAFVALPRFASGILGGTIVDRLGYRRVSIAADVVGGIGIGLIPLLYHTAGLAFWQLLLLVLLGNLLEVPGLTARRAMLPELARVGQVLLERVNASFEGIQYLSLLLGPPLAGVLIGWLAADTVLWIDAASFAASALIVGLAVPMSASTVRVASGRYWAELMAGLRFLRRDRLLFFLAAQLGVTNAISGPFFAVALPVYAKETYGDATRLGLMIAASGAGSVAGVILYGVAGYRLPRRGTWIAAYLIVPVDLWCLSLRPPFWLILAVFAFAAFTGAPVNPLLVTVRHERIPSELRGRVFSTFSAITAVAAPLGVLFGGTMIDAVGLSATLLTLAVLGQVTGLTLIFVPVLHEMNQRQGDSAARASDAA